MFVSSVCVGVVREEELERLGVALVRGVVRWPVAARARGVRVGALL